MDADQAATAQRLFAIVGNLVGELHPRRRAVAISLATRLDRDLELDSLARAELLLRVERAFQVRFPERLLGEVATVGDVVSALAQAAPQLRIGPAEAWQPTALPLVAGAPDDARTLIEVLEWHVERHPDRMQVTVLRDDLQIIGSLTYRQLADQARAVAAGLYARDVAPGDRVALMLSTSADFFVAFFGVLHAGAVPVPIYPPARPAQIEDHLRRQAGILRNAGVAVLIGTQEMRVAAELLRGQVESLEAIVSVADLHGRDGAAPAPAFGADATAFIQYTSGSTGDPKGVVLSHANLLANIRAMGRAMDASAADIFVSWLPLYHDMGLIGAWLGTLYYAAPLYVMSPLAFLVRPQRWLWAIHRCRATLTAAPNFAFELCLSKLDDADLAGLDLSSLRMVANGAEPVSPATVRRFSERFQRFGFQASAMAPVYGLAESAVGLCFPPLGRAPLIDRVDRDALTRTGTAAPAAADDARALEIVACGQPLPGHEIRIVDPQGRELGERQEGRLEFRGPSATAGYFRNEEKTRSLFRGGWLDSGDRAYLAGGDVYVTGRVKDIIIRAGRNVYPQEVEEAIGAIPGVRKGAVAVFGVSDPSSGTERLVVLAETRQTTPTARSELQRAIAQVTQDMLETPADEIVLAPPRTVPKTSSGKVRRSAAKTLLERGEVGRRPQAPWRQVLRLRLASIGPQFGRVRRRVSAALYAAYWWAAIVLGATIGAVAVLLLPRSAWRWAAVRIAARAVLFVIGARLTVTGPPRAPENRYVVVVNHSSYLDSLVLAAVLPGEPAFVAKRELSRHVLAGPLLRRLGALFVERDDPEGGVADTNRALAAAQAGRALVFYPEGTFTRMPGLLAFRLGAFKIAAETGRPVIPVALRGARSMLRGDQWFPRHGAISVEFAEPIQPAGADFAAAVQLRDAARAAILTRCGEPDLRDAPGLRF